MGKVESKVAPLSIYEGLNNHSYIVELMGISDVYGNSGDVQFKVQQIDRAMKHLLQERNWQPTTVAYRDIYKEVFKELKLSPHLSNSDMLDRIFYYFQFKALAYARPI